jgi:hypothetical protein
MARIPSLQGFRYFVLGELPIYEAISVMNQGYRCSRKD